MDRREPVVILACLLFAAAMFFTGISWGLPSRLADPYLFGSRTPWTGEEILALAGGWNSDPKRGADVDLNPLADRSKLLRLNGTDAERAEIVRRYRLFTCQPDEWITMRSLAGMSPRSLRLDPKVYQYGGLWIYPVGAMLKIASLCGVVELRGGPEALAYYLDHPETFGRFYVVARSYSAMWGIIATWAAYALARRMTGTMVGAAAGAVCFAAMPVVVNMAHEAKPHLAGLALMLLAVLAAWRFVESGRVRWSLAAGALCGAAFGMVISSLVIFVILPVMVMLRPTAWRDRIWITFRAGIVGTLVYAITNPYVWINALRNPAVLKSNLGTSTAMYNVDAGGGAFGNAALLMSEGISPVLAGVGMAVLIACVIIAVRRRRVGGSTALLIAVPALLVAIQFIALGRGKPGEYGRFALLPDTALALCAVAVVARIPRIRVVALGFLAIATAAFGMIYVQKFADDSQLITSRMREAERLSDLHAQGPRKLLVIAEPAPYCLPPVDLFTWSIEIVPRGAMTADGVDVLVRAVDSPTIGPAPENFIRLAPIERSWLSSIPAPISWADKPFDVFVRAGK